MTTNKEYPIKPVSEDLFDRVVSKPDQAHVVSGWQIHHNACDVLETTNSFFASKYMFPLPTKEELKRVLDREKQAIEERLAKPGKESKKPAGKLILESIR